LFGEGAIEEEHMEEYLWHIQNRRTVPDSPGCGEAQRQSPNGAGGFVGEARSVSQADCIGLILLDAQHCVLQTALKGQEYLALLADARLGEPMTHLGKWPLLELIRASTSPGGKMHPELRLRGLTGQVFEVVVQPVVVLGQIDGWVLMVCEVAQGEEIPSLCAPPAQSMVFHWPPASPLTSNLP
jgi:hypothetical protein